MLFARFVVARRSTLAFALSLVVLLTACDDSTTAPAVHAPVSTVEIVTAGATLTVGEERAMVARLRDRDGAQLAGRTITWLSSDPSVVMVSDAGRLQAIRTGTVIITARSEGRENSVQIAVQAAPVASIQLSDTAFMLYRQNTRMVQATAKDQYGRSIQSANIAWTSQDPSIATVNEFGRVTAIASGSTHITASSGGRVADLLVTVPVSIVEVRVTPAAKVLEVGASQQYAAQVIDDRGRVLENSQLQWSSSDPSVVQVSAHGVVTAIARGYATITARAGYQTGSVAVTVVGDWQFDYGARYDRLLLDTVTVRKTDVFHVMRVARVESVRFNFHAPSGQWHVTVRVAREEVSDFLGNMMYRVLSYEDVLDYGDVSGYDLFTGAPLLRSRPTQTPRFAFAEVGTQHWLKGHVRGFPLAVSIPLSR